MPFPLVAKDARKPTALTQDMKTIFSACARLTAVMVADFEEGAGGFAARTGTNHPSPGHAGFGQCMESCAATYDADRGVCI